MVESHLGELLENILCTVLAMLVSDWLFYSSLKNSALYVRARPEYLVLVHVSCSITMGIVSYPSTMSIYDISVHLRRQTTVFSSFLDLSWSLTFEKNEREGGPCETVRVTRACRMTPCHMPSLTFRVLKGGLSNLQPSRAPARAY